MQTHGTLDDSFRAGSALVTNTMLVQGSRFAADPSQVMSASTVEAFFDLCSLVEAVILRRRLYTLEGELGGYSANYSSLPLISALHHAGILHEHAIPLDPAGVQRELLTIVGTDRIFNRLDIRGVSLNITDMLPDVFPDEAHHSTSTHNYPEGDRRMFMLLMGIPAEAEKIFNYPPNIFEFFRGAEFIKFLQGTGDEQRGAYALRTYVYSHSACRERIAFIPDYPRIPFISSALDQFYSGVVMKSYESLANKLQCEADEFLQDARPLGLLLPPFTSLLLSRCQSTKDIAPVLLDMRKEFEELRESLATLEEKLLNSTNISERNTARGHVEAVFAAVSKKYDQSSIATFKSLVNFAGDAIAPAFNPTNPAAYGANLITKPIDWLQDWWYRRPLAQFFDLAEQFRTIQKYNRLVGKVFKIEFDREDIQKFRKTQLLLSKMFTGEGGKPHDG